MNNSKQGSGRHASIATVSGAFVCLAALFSSAHAADIRVSMLTDIRLGQVAPTTGQLLAATDFCVSMSERGRYSVVARGVGPGDRFVLSNGVSAIPLEVYYSDRPGQRGARLTPGNPLTGLRAKKRKRRRDCNRLNASMEIVIGAPDLEASSSGNYQGVVMLTVSPE